MAVYNLGSINIDKVYRVPHLVGAVETLAAQSYQEGLGGKGANIVFEDADINAAVAGSAFAIFHNQGQACIAGSRLLLHTSIADEFLDRFITLARSIKLGDPLDPETEMGPLTSIQHLQRVLNYCQVARDDGGEILSGGRQPNDPILAKGCFVEPTIVRAHPGMEIVQDETFAPLVYLFEVDTLDQLAQVLEVGGADVVLLDNMPPEVLKQAVALVDGRIVTEASGNIRRETVAAVAATTTVPAAMPT